MGRLKTTFIISSLILLGIIILMLYKFSVNATRQNSKRLAEIMRQDSLRVDSTKFFTSKLLFEKNCNACHNFYKTDNFLIGVVDRWHSRDTLKMFIKDPAGTAKINEYAKKVIDEYVQVKMPSYPNLKDEELELMVYFMDAAPYRKNN
jgi:hypothetical protein